MKKIILAVICVAMLGGCYTQLLTYDEMYPPAPQVSYEIDSLTNDTVKVVHKTDTIIRQPDQNPYWTPNGYMGYSGWYGNSYYSRDWLMFNDYPWWYHRSSYGYDYYGFNRRYYHPQYYHMGVYYLHQNSNGSVPVSVPAGNGKPRRTSSSDFLKIPVPALKSDPGLSKQNPAAALESPQKESALQNQGGEVQAPPPPLPPQPENQGAPENNRSRRTQSGSW